MNKIKCFNKYGMFMWVKLVVDAHGKVHQVKCKVYVIIKSKKKSLAFKYGSMVVRKRH